MAKPKVTTDTEKVPKPVADAEKVPEPVADAEKVPEPVADAEKVSEPVADAEKAPEPIVEQVKSALETIANDEKMLQTIADSEKPKNALVMTIINNGANHYEMALKKQIKPGKQDIKFASFAQKRTVLKNLVQINALHGGNRFQFETE